MNILITGDAGFVGRHLSKALSDRGDSVFGFDIKTGLSLDAFLTDFHALCKYDVAIHLAANIVNVDAREKMGVRHWFAWLIELLKTEEDDPMLFPKGKWATIQVMQELVELSAKEAVKQ